MSWDGTERRRHRRYGVKGSVVRWRPGAPIGWISPPSPAYLLIDLSTEGCRFISKSELRPGRRLSLSIDAPVLRGTLRLSARVVWSRRSDELDAWHTGIALDRHGPRAAARLKILLDGSVLDRIEITTRHYLKEIGKL